ncbi:MAG: PVC-type heme-binding CxxCH protein, partial [Verrucomicrobiaceae bacterium]
VAFDWDERGRLWVVEMADYPLGMDGKGKPGSRVVMLEDTDADGRYDKRTVIADGLNFATGILTWRDGVLVTAAPDILFIKGDGSGKKVLFTGFSEGNQQLRVNGLRWGMDGWVYCAGGAHTVDYNTSTSIVNKITGGKIELGARDFRFKPDTGEFDPQTGPAQFGRARDDWDHWFGVQNSKPLWHYVLQDHYLRRNPNVIPPDPVKQMYKLNPPVYAASPPEKRYHSFDHATAYTSACGINIYRGGTLFDDGKMHAFTCEPFHNLAQHHVMEDDGVSFKAQPDTDGKVPDFFASEDRWCRPVMVRDGPDGALYIADMYRYMIEHPQWLPQNGKDELLPFYREGDDKGRIYRISKAGDSAKSLPKSFATLKSGIATLSSNTGWLRDKAQMLIACQQPKDLDAQLIAMTRDGATPQARAQAAWTLHSLGRMTPRICERLLADPSPRVREQALIIAENFMSDEALMKAMDALADDKDAKVRLQLAFSCTRTSTLAKLLQHDAADAVVAGCVLMRRGLIDELADDTLKTISPAILASGDHAMIDRWIERVGKHATDRETVMILATSVKHRATVVAQSEAWLRPQSPVEDQRRAIAVLTIAHPPMAFEWMTSDWSSRTPESRREIVTVLLNEGGWTRAFLKIATPNDFDASQRATLLNHPDKNVAALAASVFKSDATPARAAVLEKFKSALSLNGDAARGKQVFTTAGCIACHQLEGAGLPVGPDLRSVVQHTPDKLFNSILDPSANIEPGFAAYHCALKNGEQLYGIVATETGGSITMRLAGNITRSVLRGDIATLKNTQKSLMPDGLEAALTPQSLADLIKYLQIPK